MVVLLACTKSPWFTPLSKVQFVVPYRATDTPNPDVELVVATPVMPVRWPAVLFVTRADWPCVPLLNETSFCRNPDVQVALQVNDVLVVPTPVAPVAPVVPVAP